METVGSSEARILQSKDFPIRRWNSLKPWKEVMDESEIIIQNSHILEENFPFPPRSSEDVEATLVALSFRDPKESSEVLRIMSGSMMEPADLADLLDWGVEHYQEIFKEGEDRSNYSLILFGSIAGIDGNHYALRFFEGANGPSLDIIPLRGRWVPDHIFLCRRKETV